MQIGVKVVPLACCAVEAGAASRLYLPYADDQVELLEFQPSAQYDVNLLVVAGTVTKQSAVVLKQIWGDLAEPKLAVAYGVCAISGGPYWDSYAVVNGAAEVIPIAAFVPGCPPPAATMIPAILQAVAAHLEAVQS
jgi:NADH-quinone oxidoreductase subunit B